MTDWTDERRATLHAITVVAIVEAVAPGEIGLVPRVLGFGPNFRLCIRHQDAKSVRETPAHKGGEEAKMTDLARVSLSVREPHDREVVYARAKHGTPQKVIFYAKPARWIGADIVYQLEYFREWAPLESGERSRMIPT